LAGKTQEERHLTRYLLGELQEREREQLEETYFADDVAFEQIIIAEEELIDAYVRGELSAEERVRFEELFRSSPRGRERVQFARSLADAVSSAQPAAIAPEATRPIRSSFFAALLTPRIVALRYALAVIVLVAAVVLPWLLVERARMRDELRQLRDERAVLQERAQELERRAAAEQRQSEELRAQLKGDQAQPAPSSTPPPINTARQDRPSPDKGGTQTPRPAVVAFTLSPGLVRGGGAKPFILPRNASSVVLRLNIEAATHASYRAVIETVGGRQVWRADSVEPGRATRAGGAIVLPALPAKDLPDGDYILLLSGKQPDGSFEDVADYSFRIARK
jgi:anti-sigma factor RsiW